MKSLRGFNVGVVVGEKHLSLRFSNRAIESSRTLLAAQASDQSGSSSRCFTVRGDGAIREIFRLQSQSCGY